MLKPRKCIRELRPYHSPLSDVQPELRLDMNESTTGCSPQVLARLKSLDAKTIALYPSRERAERMVATVIGRPTSQLLLTNGADEAIDLLSRAYIEPEDEVIVITPAFPMYEVFGQAAGAKVVKIPAEPEYAFPLAEVLAAINPRTRLIVITNPNNPTGAVTPDADIMQVIKAAPDAAVLVDEAYYEFCGQTMMNAVGTLQNLFIARTFSKAYGLAGMRVGVLVGAKEQISAIRRTASPFNINVFAVECLQDALRDRKFVQDYVTQVKTTREWFRAQVEELGFKAWPSAANFVLVSLGEQKDAILNQMRMWGIALRDRPDCPGCVRITIGKQDEMEVVVLALKKALSLLSGKSEQEQQEDEGQQDQQEQPAP
jgi:histidinol-phosphate aminotransferase